MRSRAYPARRIGIAGFAALAALLAGCRGGGLIAQKDQKIDRLQRQSLERQEALAEARAQRDELEKRLGEALEEGTAARERVKELQKKVRTQEETVSEAKAKNVRLSSRVMETERAYEELKKRLEDVQDDASTFAERLSDLRIGRRESEERIEALSETAMELRGENSRLRKDLERARDQLKRTEVALRSTKEGQASETDAEKEKLRQQVADLREAVQAHQEERVALHGQVEELKDLLPDSAVARVTEGGNEGGIYEDDARGLWSEVQGFLAARFGPMVKGEAEWDRVDVTLVVATGVLLLALLALLWIPLRWRKNRRLRRELKTLRRRLRSSGNRENAADASRARRQRERPSHVVRRGGAPFSPILSAEDVDSGADTGGGSGTEQAGVQPAPAAGDSAGREPPASTKGGRAARGSQVIGAHQWAEGGGADEEDFGNTQVIGQVGGIELGAAASPASGSFRDPLAKGGPPASGSPPETAPSPAASQDAGDEDEEFGHTQVIPGLPEVEGLGTGTQPPPSGPSASSTGSTGESEKPPAKKESGAELMDELEDLIGKKVDELIQ